MASLNFDKNFIEHLLSTSDYVAEFDLRNDSPRDSNYSGERISGVLWIINFNLNGAKQSIYLSDFEYKMLGGK